METQYCAGRHFPSIGNPELTNDDDLVGFFTLPGLTGIKGSNMHVIKLVTAMLQ